MSLIKGKDTRPELIIRKYLFARGFRFRLHDKKIPGTPDIILKKHKAVVFVNGCFWHGHYRCKYYRKPKSNVEFWSIKIKTNKERDKRKIAQLERMGWKVFTVWECELKQESKCPSVEKLVRELEIQ